MKRRLLSFFVCLALLISVSVYRPQRAEAVGLTASAIIVSGIVAVMAACGVTIAAQTDTGITDYITDKLDDYFQTLSSVPESILEWLELESPVDVFTVLTSGQLRFTRPVANKILDFVRWFNSYEGVQSGGESVGVFNDVLAFIPFNTETDLNSVLGNSLQLYFDSSSNKTFYICNESSNTNLYTFAIHDSPNYIIYLLCNVVNVQGHFRVYSRRTGANTLGGYNGTVNILDQTSSLYYYNLPTISDTVDLGTIPLFNSLRDAIDSFLDFDDGVEFTPSQTVAVPLDVPEGATLDITTNAMISEGDTVEDAAQAIFDVVQTDGLTSDPSLDVGGGGSVSIDFTDVLDALADILAAILNGPTTIVTGISNLISTPLTTIINSITALPNSIQSAFSTLFANVISKIDSIPSAISAAFATVLNDIKGKIDDVKSAILGIPSAIGNAVSSVLTNLFVPSRLFINQYVATLYSNFDNHFSILSYPFSILGEFLTRVATAGSSDPIFTWPNIYEPFSNKLLIAAGQYNLNDAKSNATFANVYSIYMIVVKGFLSFQFLSFLYAWFCDVFKMRNSDFDDPSAADWEEE